MRVLIDECIDERLRHEFYPHECQTARYADLAGLKTGHLLEAAEAAGFDVLITVDRGIPYQQNLRLQKIAILILEVPTSLLADLSLTVPAALRALGSIRSGEVVTVSRNFE